MTHEDIHAMWREQAACAKRGVDPDWFFPEPHHSQGRGVLAAASPGILQAKRVCATCPVAAPCLEYGLTHNVAGIMGGMTIPERKKERRRRKADAAAVADSARQ